MEPFPFHICSSVPDGIEHRLFDLLCGSFVVNRDSMDGFERMRISGLETAQPTLQRVGNTDFALATAIRFLYKIHDVRLSRCWLIGHSIGIARLFTLYVSGMLLIHMDDPFKDPVKLAVVADTVTVCGMISNLALVTSPKVASAMLTQPLGSNLSKGIPNLRYPMRGFLCPPQSLPELLGGNRVSGSIVRDATVCVFVGLLLRFRL